MSASALQGEVQADQALYEDLTERLLIQKAIVASLQSGPFGSAEREEMDAAKAEIEQLGSDRNKARAQLLRSKAAAQQLATIQHSQSSPSMRTFDSSTSGLIVPTAGPATNSLSRKRSMPLSSPSHEHPLASRLKYSRTASNSPSRTLHSSSANHVDYASSIIDLTGDDDDFDRTITRMKEEEERLRRNKMRADEDAVLARELQGGHPLASSPYTQPGPSSQPDRNNAFDRILPRPSQQPRSQSDHEPARAEPTAQPRASSHHASSVPNKLMSRMPGSFADYVSDDESDSSLEIVGYNSAPRHQGTPNAALGLPGPPLPGYPSHLPGFGMVPGNYYAYAPNVPATEIARRAAVARQMGLPARDFTTASYEANNSLDWHQNRPGYLNGGHFHPASHHTSPMQAMMDRVNNYDFNQMRDEYGVPLNPHLVNFLDDYVHDPRKTQQEIQDLLANIRPDMEIPTEERGETPEALKYPLYPHQQLALKWMTSMEEGTNKGGILADDMGLGKTISTLALMVTRKAPDNIKTNLIIGPVALIRQWELEIKKKLKIQHRLSVFLLHGKKASYSDLKRFDVVLTTYGSVASEWKRYESHVKVREASAQYNPADDAELQKKCPLLHLKSKFLRVILDEAQCIKNKDTQGARGTSQIQATYRWCLTGTPMMNGVNELYSLVRFLRIKPYHDAKKFSIDFGSLSAKKATNYQRDNAMKQLQVLLKAIMLRRMKTSEIDGKPILILPPKVEHSDHVVFSAEEDAFYKALETKSQVTFNKYLRAGTVGKNYTNILVLLLRLRQACCHPHLNLDFEVTNAGDLSDDQMVVLAKSLEEAVVNRIKEIETFECPVCYEPVSDPTLVIPCGHDTCGECFANILAQAEENNIRDGREGRSASCPQCRGSLDDKKAITYSMFKTVHMPETLDAAGGEGASDALQDDDSDDSDDSDEDGSEADSDADADSNGDLRDFIVADDIEDDDQEEAESSERAAKSKGRPKSKSKSKGKGKGKAKAKAKGKRKAKEVLPHELKSLRQEASKNKDARSCYMRYLKKNWLDSAKVSKVLEILESIEESGEKTIVFSQWTSLLDLVEVPLKHKLKQKYCRYDGGMSRDQRDRSILDFMENPETKVMLVSLRAGNAGLNLTVASHVIMLDPFWNPYIEMQAVDRAHRIGQQNSVHVHRILVKDTVEDRIIALQDRKRELINTALDEGEAKNLSRLTHRELAQLFGMNQN